MDDLTTATPPVKRRRLHSIRPPPPPPNLLAAFGANKSRMPSSRMERQAAGRELRQTAIVASYAESEDSTPPTSPQSVSSVYETPDTSRMSASLEEHSESDTEGMGDADGPQAADVIHVAQRSAPTKILPYRSTRGKVSFAVPRRKLKTKVVGKHGTKAERLLKSKTIRSAKALSTSTINTARSLVRQNILERTKPKRDAFILAHSERFLPLLPETNYVGKLELTNSVNSKVSAEYTAIHQPNGIAANMKPYQLEGLSFLVYMYNNGTSAILGDEMGLGKTLQTLALFQYLEEEEQQQQQQQQHIKSTGGELRPHVVICPLSVLSSWMNEARRWTPGLKVLRFHGPKSERDKMKKELSGSGQHLDLIVTTYETFVAEESWFKRAFAWRYAVLDEGHKIKNDKSNVASAIQSLQAEYRLLLTGTPLQNNLLEMWSLLHWLYPEAFTVDTSEKFKRAFNLSQGQVSTRFMDDVRYLLELIMLRRLKSSPGVDLDLPPRQEILLHVPLTPMQRFWYTRLLTKSDNAMLEELFQGAAAKEKKDSDSTDVWAESKQITEQAIASADASSNEWKKLRNLVMQLQKVCSHPYLLKNAIPEPYILGDHIMTASGKFIVLDKLVEKLVVQDRKKVLIFSGFTTVLDFCEDLLALKGANTHQASFRYTRLDGGTERAKRNLAIRLFNDPRSDFKIMLISTRAGGLGINLASASDVIFLDEDWNPQVTLQAEARAHRIGQTQAVTVYKISTQGTVEEQMMSRIRKKQYLTAKITESMRSFYTTEEQAPSAKKRKRTSHLDSNEAGPKLGTTQLKSLLRQGARTLTHPEIDVTEMLGWDFETMIDKCRDRGSDVEPNGDTLPESDEQEWLHSMEKVECAVFEGKKHQRDFDKALETIELSRADRRVGKNTTVMIDGFAINEESLRCGDWEAVPTLAGKDPRLAEPVRAKKAKVVNQEQCQCCWDGGQIVLCSGCPRAYHLKCLNKDFKIKAKGATFFCPQHQCSQCEARTTDAGGLIYRCRWCEDGYCEDCLDWETTRLVGESLPEFEMLGFGPIAQAWYIDCPACIKRWEADKGDHAMVLKECKRIDKDYAKFLAARSNNASSTPQTISEVATPVDMKANTPTKKSRLV